MLFRAILHAALLATCCASVSQAALAQGYPEGFATYYEAMDKASSEVLLAELTDVIESAVLNAEAKGHLTSPGVAHKVRQYRQKLFLELRTRLCQGTSVGAMSRGGVKLLLDRATRVVAKAQKVSITDEERGQIAGVVARIVESASLGGFCKGENFEALAP